MSLRLMLRYRHGMAAWDGQCNGEWISMLRAAPMADWWGNY
jgi:hypothetical protein